MDVLDAGMKNRADSFVVLPIELNLFCQERVLYSIRTAALWLLLIIVACLWQGQIVAKDFDSVSGPRNHKSLDQNSMGQGWDFAKLVREGLESSPYIKKLRYRTQAAQFAAEAAGRPADPVLKFVVTPIPIETRVGPQWGQVWVTQKLFYPGKLDIRKAIAQAKISVVSADADAQIIRWVVRLKKLGLNTSTLFTH